MDLKKLSLIFLTASMFFTGKVTLLTEQESKKERNTVEVTYCDHVGITITN
jgi:hypothetical protein